MSSQLKPIKVWGQGGPNPPKVAFILAELGVPHEIISWPITDVKKPEYLALNPNGRLPTIQDPNTGITLWESGAIIEYLIEQYDTQQKLSFEPRSIESYHAKQFLVFVSKPHCNRHRYGFCSELKWLFFQTTGQAPYYGQAAWFKKFHHEHLPSALDRYLKEMQRVSGVLDGWLAKQKEQYGTESPWLVGNRISYADISFVSWQMVCSLVLSKEEYNMEDFPNLKEWIDRMVARDTIKNALEKAFQGH